MALGIMIWPCFGFLAFVFVILVVLLVVKSSSSRRPTQPRTQPMEDLASLTIKDARLGDNIAIPGGGDDYGDLNFTINRVNRYEAGGQEWFEYSGMYNGRRVFVEVVEDDEVETFIDLSANAPALADLGLSEDDLVRMDETQEKTASFNYNGSSWRYDQSREIGYFKDCTADGEGYYSWDFREVDGERYVTVEKWEGEPFEVRTSRKINPDDVQLFRTS